MERFRGGFPATIDVKGRVKLPARLREQLESGFGTEIFVCSFFSRELRIYPLATWEQFEENLLAMPSFKRSVRKLLERVNYGQHVEMDAHGRIVVPLLLREMVDVEGDVVISGRINYLAVTKRTRAASFLQEDSLSDEETDELAELGL